MATTQKGIYYPDDYTAIADIPEDMKDLAESVDTALGNLEDNIEEEQTTQNNEITALQTENTRLKATLPTTTGEGENITLQNTAELEFIQPPLPGGNSEQVQYSGKNLLNLVIAADTKGLTVTKNEDGTITLNGTTSYGGVIYISEDFTTIANQDYTISSHVKSGTTTDNPHTTFWNSVASAWFFDVSVGTSQTKQYSSPVTHKFSIYVHADKTYTNYTIDIQVEQSSTATAYEPYVGGTASPNPSYPQEITNVTGDVDVLVQNKNLATEIVQGNIDTTTGQNIINPNANYGITPNYIEINQTNIAVQYQLRNSTSYQIVLYKYDKDKNFLGFNAKSSNSNVFTVDSNVKYIRVRLETPEANVSSVYDVMIEQNTTATTYTPHQEQTFTFPLGTQRMYLGDYLADDGIHHVRKQTEITAENVESLVGGLNTTTYSKPYVTISKSLLGWKSSWTQNISILNNYSVITSTSKIDSGTYAVNFIQSYLTIFDDRFTDLATARQLMIGTIIEIEQAEEWIEAYTTEQQQAYDEIKQAISYEEQTNISGSSDESNPLFSVEAYQSIKLLLQEISNAVVALGGV